MAHQKTDAVAHNKAFQATVLALRARPAPERRRWASNEPYESGSK